MISTYLQVILMDSCSVNRCNFGVPREEVSSESSYLAILDTPPPFHSFSNCSFDFYHLLLNSSLLRFYEQVIITVSIMSIILWISKWKINIEK